MSTKNEHDIDTAGIYSTVVFVVDELCELYVGDNWGENESNWNRS